MKYEGKLRNSALVILFESNVELLNEKVKEIFMNTIGEERETIHISFLESPVKKVYNYGLSKLDEIYKGEIPIKFLNPIMEHNDVEVRRYGTKLINTILTNP